METGTNQAHKKPPRGFIALISTVIIATILIGLALSVGGSGVFARFDVLNSEFKRISLGLAESCANVALLKIGQNYNYAPAVGGDVISIGNDAQGRAETCSIDSVTFPNGKAGVQNIAVIKTSAEYPVPNGANSSVAISASIQNPGFAVPAKGSLNVIVNVVNQYGGLKQASDFPVTVTGTNAFPNSFSGTGGTGTLVFMDAGAYTVTVPNVAGYNQSATNCNGNITAGAALTCTITESDVATTGTITVTAQVLNDNGGTKLPSDFPLFLDGASVISGVPVKGLLPGSHTASAPVAPAGYTASVWGYDCSAGGSVNIAAGNQKTCIIIYDDIAPPSPICVDTVLMLDRTGSMTGGDLTSEKTAANGLLNLYSALVPAPKSSVGVFGAVGASEPYNASIVQSLTNAYATLTTAVNNGLANSGGFTNLASAISTAQAEFTAHGTPGKGHVLILLSDGGANRPNAPIIGDTGVWSPTANAQNAVNDNWTSPINAYAAGGGDASTAVSTGHRHRYSAFNFAAIPAGATITGIEADVDADATAPVGAPVNTGNLSPSSEGNYGGWTPNLGFNNSNSRTIAVQGAGGTYLRALANGNANTFRVSNAGVPAGSTINSVTLYALVDTSGGNSNVQLRVENGAGAANHKEDGGHLISNNAFNTTISWAMATNPLSGSAWTLAEVNNWTTNFGMVRTNLVGGTPQVDQVYVVVNYTPPPATACQLGMDVSWNNGVSWTPEKTVTLSNLLATYVFGSSADTWGGAHVWTQPDFTNANFIARVHAIDPGVNCDNAAVNHVDWLRMRVYYSTATDPYESALVAADTAKAAGTQIFTVHYGDPGALNHDINFLANIANGSTVVPGHQPGAANDLSDVAASGNTGYASPTTNATDTGGSGNGFESSPTGAYADSGTFAGNINGAGDRHRYSGYTFNVPANSTIAGIVVRPDWWTDTTSGTNSVNIELSWDGGAHWTAAKTEGSESTADTNGKTVGASNDTWGHVWTSADLATGNFVVRITSNCSNSGSCNTRDFYLDWIPVQVYYTGGVPENGDGDNFFVSPTAADMQGIFQSIGEEVCPALTAPPPAAPPTTGTLLVITHVINDNGGINVPGDFTWNVLAGVNPSLTTGTGVDSPGVSITMNPGAYSIDQAATVMNYTKTLGANCSGNMAAGQVLTCTITDDDIPPPAPALPTAPPPPSSVNIGSWQEVP